jgi:coproporphyrinogen III oxidase
MEKRQLQVLCGERCHTNPSLTLVRHLFIISNVHPGSIVLSHLVIERRIAMVIETNLPYPKDEYLNIFQDFYADINGEESFDETRNWESDKWSATVHCSRGTVLEKAGFSRVKLVGGEVRGNATDISLFETLAYPANPRVPGFIIMTNTNSSEAMGNILVFYIDLIIQDGRPHDEEKRLFALAAGDICERHGHDMAQYQPMVVGRGLLGGNAGECGFLNFFQEKDIPLLEDLIKGMLPVYGDIIDKTKNETPQDEDFENMNKTRARLIEWIILEDYGTKLARENGIAAEAIEAYGFPPVVRY